EPFAALDSIHRCRLSYSYIRYKWCERGDSNPHGCPLDPKSFPRSSSLGCLTRNTHHFKERDAVWLVMIGHRRHKDPDKTSDNEHPFLRPPRRGTYAPRVEVRKSVFPAPPR